MRINYTSLGKGVCRHGGGYANTLKSSQGQPTRNGTQDLGLGHGISTSYRKKEGVLRNIAQHLEI
jgi:hypothetical protein